MKVQSCTGTITTAIAMGDLLLKNLPHESRKANKMDVTLPLLLLLVGTVCDSNCTAVFNKDEMLIANNDDIKIQLLSDPLVTGPRDKTGLWKIPIPEKEWVIKTPIGTSQQLALSAYNQRTEQDLAIYLHACAGSPVIETWIQAIKKG